MSKGKVLHVPFSSAKNKIRHKELEVEWLERPLLFPKARAAFDKPFSPEINGIQKTVEQLLIFKLVQNQDLILSLPPLLWDAAAPC